MKHLFIPYELSLLAKEKEFDEPCLAYYDCYNGGSHFFLNEKAVSQDYVDYITGGTDTAVLAPLYQQIIDWFREKHSFHIYIETTPAFDKIQGSKYKTSIKACFKPFKWTTAYYYLGDTYYEALTKAIEEAFKLI